MGNAESMEMEKSHNGDDKRLMGLESVQLWLYITKRNRM
jgi:hypothetical protein